MNVTQAEGHRLEAFISDRCAPQKHVWRAYNRRRLRHYRNHTLIGPIEASGVEQQLDHGVRQFR